MAKPLLTTPRAAQVLGRGEGTLCCTVEASGLFGRRDSGTSGTVGPADSGRGRGSFAKTCLPATLRSCKGDQQPLEPSLALGGLRPLNRETPVGVGSVSLQREQFFVLGARASSGKLSSNTCQTVALAAPASLRTTALANPRPRPWHQGHCP